MTDTFDNVTEYYYLVMGDFIQSGDEIFTNERWISLTEDYMGMTYGFDNDGSEYNWPPVRRLISKRKKRQDTQIYVDEQWGLEFES